MYEKNWEFVRILINYLDDLFEKMRLNNGGVLKNTYGIEQIEALQFADIRRIASAENAMEQMLFVRASYKAFIVASYLLGRDYNFGYSLRLLENTAKKAASSRAMPKRPRYLEKIFQSNANTG